jgi:hypothetical protein
MNPDLLRQAPWLTAERLWRIAAIFAGISLIGTAWDFATHTTHGVMDETGEQLARDFINYWSGAQLAVAGKAAMAYDTAAYHAYQRSLIGALSDFRMYSYPPTTMLLSLPLAWLGFIPALAAWTLAGWAWCAALLSRILGWRWGIMAAVAAPAAFVNVASGQNGNFSAALLCGGLIVLERRPVLAGVLFGCLCYKPQMGVLLPVALAMGGHWRAFIATGASAAALVAASWLAIGPEAWAGFFNQTVLQRALMELGDTLWPRMPTTFAMVRMMGGGVALGYAGQIASGAGAALVVALVWRSNASMAVKAAALVTATFLATPYAWDYDLVGLTFVAAWIATEGARGRFLPWEKFALAVLVVMPVMVGSLAKGIHVQLGPVVLWIMLGLILCRALAGERVRQCSTVSGALSG